MLILLILLLAVVAALGTVLVTYLARDTAVECVRSLRAHAAPLNVAEPLFREHFRLHTNTAVRGGNRLTLLANGDETFGTLLDAVRSARELVTWQVFWFRPGALADAVADALADRARAGVRVFVLLDAFGARGLGEAYVARLRAAGVEVAVFRPLRWNTLWKVQQRAHTRAVVVDGQVGFTGGFGIDDRWRGGGRRPGEWRDTNVRAEGPVVDQLQAAFAGAWAEATGELLVGDGLFSLEPDADAARGDDDAAGRDDVEAGVLYAAPSLGSTNAERMLFLSIAAARERLYIANAYFVPSRNLRRLLCEAAAAGVDVRVLTPGRNTDRPSAYHAARSHYEALLAGGVRLYEYEPTMMHAKTLVADGVWSCVGSVNFDNRSMMLNDEVAVVVRSATFGARLERLFVDDLAYATEVQLDAVRRRPRSDRVRESLARLVAPIL